MKNLLKIMLVEDSPEYREVVGIAIGKDSGMELVGIFGAAEVALDKLQNPKTNARPDIILLDLNLPGMSGLEAVPWIRKYTPEAKIIVLTQSDREADVSRAISLGAVGYLLKSSTIRQIKEGIRSVAEGHVLLDGSVAKFLSATLKKKQEGMMLENPLSDREMEILVLLGEGLLKKEIADRLDIGFATVATHIRHIYEKLQVENAPAAISKAYRSGILNQD